MPLAPTPVSSALNETNKQDGKTYHELQDRNVTLAFGHLGTIGV